MEKEGGHVVPNGCAGEDQRGKMTALRLLYPPIHSVCLDPSTGTGTPKSAH